MVSDAFDTEVLASLPVFNGLSREDVRELARISSLAKYPAGSGIFRENQPSDGLYAVLEGQVEIRVQDLRGEDHAIAILGPGAVLGEMSLLSKDPHSATAIAVSDVSLMRLPAAAFADLVSQGSRSAQQVVYNLAQVAVHRLREVNQRLVALLAGSEAAGQPAPATPPPVAQELIELKRKLFSEWQF